MCQVRGAYPLLAVKSQLYSEKYGTDWTCTATPLPPVPPRKAQPLTLTAVTAGLPTSFTAEPLLLVKVQPLMESVPVPEEYTTLAALVKGGCGGGGRARAHVCVGVCLALEAVGGVCKRGCMAWDGGNG